MNVAEHAQTIRRALNAGLLVPSTGRATLDAAHDSLTILIIQLTRAEAALDEIHARPYRAEEVTARYRRETR